MKEYLSYSQLKAFAKSPNHYLAYLEQYFEQTPQMLLGSVIHCKVLEPHEFALRYAVAPQADKRTKEGKAIHQAFQDKLNGQVVISEDQYDLASKVALAITDQAIDILEGTEKEITKLADIHGERFKAVADVVGANYIADLKTAADASPEAFMRQAHNLEYHLQAAIYRAVFDKPDFYWIVAETSAPFNYQVYKQSPEAKAWSDRRLYTLIQQFQQWDGTSKGYSSEILTLDLPRWA